MKSNVHELLYMIRTGDAYAMEVLLAEYRPMVIGIARTLLDQFNCTEAFKEDLTQEAFLMVEQALRTWREDGGSAFSTFVHLLTTRRLQQLIRHYRTDLGSPLRHVQFFEHLVNENESLYDVTPQRQIHFDPQAKLHYTLMKEALYKSVQDLKENDRTVLELSAKGYSYRSASDALGISYKAFDGRLQRVRRKVRYDCVRAGVLQ